MDLKKMTKTEIDDLFHLGMNREFNQADEDDVPRRFHEMTLNELEGLIESVNFDIRSKFEELSRITAWIARRPENWDDLKAEYQLRKEKAVRRSEREANIVHRRGNGAQSVTSDRMPD